MPGPDLTGRSAGRRCCCDARRLRFRRRASVVVALAAEGALGVALGRVHWGTGRLVGPQEGVPSASERQ